MVGGQRGPEAKVPIPWMPLGRFSTSEDTVTCRVPRGLAVEGLDQERRPRQPPPSVPSVSLLIVHQKGDGEESGDTK